MKPIKYDNLKEGDIVFTGGRSVFSSLIRRVTGDKNSTPRNTPTHVGIIVDFYGQKLIAEMLKDGLSISSLEEYRKTNKRFIISVGRAFITNTAINNIMRTIAIDRRKTIEYDWRGVGSFVLNVMECPEKFYCSEYVAHVFMINGFQIPIKNRNNSISPEDIFKLFIENKFGKLVDF